MSTNRILPTLWRRRWAVVLTALLCLLATAAVTFSLPKVYTSEAYLLVTPSRSVSSDFEATQLTQILTKTYSELIQAPGVGNEVDRRLGTRGSGEKVSVTAVPQSQLLVLEAEGASPQAAQSLANTFATVFAERVEALGRTGNTAGTVSVAEAARLPSSPARPRPKLNLALGAVLALLMGMLAAGLRERFDQRLDLEVGSTELFDLPIIGRLPRGAHREAGAAALAEASSMLFANLTFANLGERPRVVAVVSASEQEGKSTTSLQIGRAAAEHGIDTLVVEADLRRPSLHEKLGVRHVGHRYGFSTALLSDRVPLQEQVELAPQPAPEVLLAGPVPPNPAALLGSERLADFIRRAREDYELIIFDTPPVSAGADASFVASASDAVVLVVDASKTRRAPVLQAVEQLRRVRANVLGVVVNRDASAVDGYYYGGRQPHLPLEADVATPQPPPAPDDAPVATRSRLRGLRR